MKKGLERNVPAGIDYRTELRWIGNGLLAGFLFSIGFFTRFQSNYQALFHWNETGKTLKEYAVMPDFVYVLNYGLAGFLILAVCMILLAAYHYAYHYMGSKSIYLMRRLPDRWALFRRCGTLPAIAVVCCLLAAFILLLCYYGFYMWVTPEACLQPGQWQKIWMVWMGVRL